MIEKGREVKTLCEVEEDPREAIKRRERFAWVVVCLFSMRMIVRMRGSAWMLFEWESVGRPNCYCNYVAEQQGRPRASCGLGKPGCPSPPLSPCPASTLTVMLKELKTKHEVRRPYLTIWFTKYVHSFVHMGLQLWTAEVSWERRTRHTYCCPQRALVEPRQSTDRGMGSHQFGQLWKQLWFWAPKVGIQILRPPQSWLPNCWATQTEALTQTMTNTWVRTYSRWQPWRSKWKWGRRPWREQQRGGRCWSFPFPYISPSASSQPPSSPLRPPLRQQYISHVHVLSKSYVNVSVLVHVFPCF